MNIHATITNRSKKPYDLWVDAETYFEHTVLLTDQEEEDLRTKLHRLEDEGRIAGFELEATDDVLYGGPDQILQKMEDDRIFYPEDEDDEEDEDE